MRTREGERQKLCHVPRHCETSTCGATSQVRILGAYGVRIVKATKSGYSPAQQDADFRREIMTCLDLYNQHRPHSGHDSRTADEVDFAGTNLKLPNSLTRSFKSFRIAVTGTSPSSDLSMLLKHRIAHCVTRYWSTHFRPKHAKPGNTLANSLSSYSQLITATSSACRKSVATCLKSPSNVARADDGGVPADLNERHSMARQSLLSFAHLTGGPRSVRPLRIEYQTPLRQSRPTWFGVL